MTALLRAQRMLAALSTLLVVGCSSLLSEDEPYGSIRLSVVTSDGSPVAGSAVLLYTGQRHMDYDTTDANGVLLFRRVPPNQYGVVIEIPRGFMHRVPGDQYSYRDDIIVVAGEQDSVEFVLTSAGLGALEAEVVDSALQPVEGVNLTVYTSREVVAVIQTGVNGLARIDSLPVGAYGVSMFVPDSLGENSGPFLYVDTLTVRESLTPRPRFVIPACRGEIEVTVHDQANQPISGMTVTRYNSRGLLGFRATTADGDARFGGILCGVQGVRLEARQGFSVANTQGLGYEHVSLRRGSTARVTLRATRN